MASGMSLNKALAQFEVAHANLVKLERLWREIEGMIPEGIVFATNDDYEDKVRAYKELLAYLPSVSGFKPETAPLSLDEIAQSRMDAQEIGDFEARMGVEKWIDHPRLELREYRYRLQALRKKLVRNTISRITDNIDGTLNQLATKYDINSIEESNRGRMHIKEEFMWETLKDLISELNALLGDSVERPARWSDLLRHLKFGQLWDLHDILTVDWPMVKEYVSQSLSQEDDPIETDVADLSILVEQRPTGRIATKLAWDKLDDDAFERLIYTLISSEPGYENAQWLMTTRAADKGRDLSVTRVYRDGLAGLKHQRVIVQCKHFLSKSISMIDIAMLREQMKLWEPPRVDILIIATSGRFTADAVSAVEQHNQSNSALTIEMWPESHLENLLASRPQIIGEFRLR